MSISPPTDVAKDEVDNIDLPCVANGKRLSDNFGVEVPLSRSSKDNDVKLDALLLTMWVGVVTMVMAVVKG